MKFLIGDKFLVGGYEALLIFKNKDIVKLHISSYPPSVKTYQIEEFIFMVGRLLVIKIKRDVLKRENIASHLLDFQFAIIGKSSTDMVIEDKKAIDYEIPRIAYNAYRSYAIAMLKKVHKCNRKTAENNFEWFYERFGMKIKD